MTAIPALHGPTPGYAGHLPELEREAIHIMRDVVGQCRAPVMLYSVGKDSSVLLHLALKAFRPGPLPFPLLHIDTGWKFREMIAFRDATAARCGARLIVHHNAAGAAAADPFTAAAYYTRVMKTDALKQALDSHGFDAAFGGARRDEDPARAKERIVSVRGPGHVWDPKSQRPEMGTLTNASVPPGGSVRVFPLSNWTEADIWAYIAQEAIDVVPLYFAHMAPVVNRDGSLIVVHDDRMRMRPGEAPGQRRVRFRSLGCYPLTAAVESDAATIAEVLAETRAARRSERGGRLIDRDDGSLESKKREGYF